MNPTLTVNIDDIADTIWLLSRAVAEGEITVIKQTRSAHKDVSLTLTGAVRRVFAEGRVRTLFTDEGVELARYVIGKKNVVQVVLLRAAAEQSTPLEMFENVYASA